MSAIESFEKLGNKASFHYADDSTREWGLASKAVNEAIKIFDDNPNHHAEMRQIANGFLWAGEFKRLRPDRRSHE